ncbi:MAG TPA: hypothetical protein PKV73_01145 [Agriterribacter sp.]|nr:hypothetical protein [Agriterribacter sp.]
MSLDQKIKELEDRLKLYEQNGSAKLYYALQRKMNEMADMLNSVSLKNLDIVAKADASFERVFKLLEKSETVSTSAKALGEIAGVTGDENKDVVKKPFIDRIADTRN